MNVAVECLRELPNRAAVTWYCDARSSRTERDLWTPNPYAPKDVGIQLSFFEATTVVTFHVDGYILPAGKKRRIYQPHFDYHILTAARVECDAQERLAVNGVHEIIAREVPVLLYQAQHEMPYIPNLTPAENTGSMICHRISTGTSFHSGTAGIDRTQIYRESLESLVTLARLLSPRGHVDKSVQR